MIWFFYNLLFVVGFILMLPRFLYRMMRRGGYAHDFAQRFGIYRPELRAQLAARRRVWLHAVSVGEIFVALKLMKEWRVRQPDVHFVLSTTTSTGYAIAQKEVRAPDVFIYFPLDFPPVMSRVLNRINPLALILVELELWPNLVRMTKKRGAPIILINGRISDHSFKGYQKLRIFTRRILSYIDLLAVQSDTDKERLVHLGADPSKVHVTGTAKYDVATMEEDAQQRIEQVLRKAGIAQGDKVLMGGSTWAGEEAALLDVYLALRAKHPSLKLVMAPRHVERAKEVLDEINARKLTVVRRTEVDRVDSVPDILLIDTTGELKKFFAYADIIFIGKSLTQHGGQNIIEPALYGKCVVVGPHMENFRSVVDDFLEAKALLQVKDAADFKQAIERLLLDEPMRLELGRHAADVVLRKRGALQQTLDLVMTKFNN